MSSYPGETNCGGRMNKKVLAGICLVAVLLIGGIVAFAIGNNDSGKADEQSAASSPTGSATSPSAGAAGTAGGSAAVPVFPTPSLPAGSEDAKTALAINQIIFEVTQEALDRPKDQRMTAEEINARIQTRIEELKKEGGN